MFSERLKIHRNRFATIDNYRILIEAYYMQEKPVSFLFQMETGFCLCFLGWKLAYFFFKSHTSLCSGNLFLISAIIPRASCSELVCCTAILNMPVSDFSITGMKPLSSNCPL